FEVDEIGADERREAKDDGGRIAAGVGDEPRGFNLGRVELRRAIDGLGLQLRGAVRVRIVQLIDGAVVGVAQTPGGGEIDNADVVRESDGRELSRLLVRQGEKEEVDTLFGERVPGEGNNLGGVRIGCAGERWVEVDETRGLLGAFAAEEDGRRGETRMVQ